MRGFGDDCDSLAGLVVLSHKPTLERLLERERMTAESRERNKEIVCGLVGWKETGWNWASGCPWREKRTARQPSTRAVQANDTMDMPGVGKEGVGRGSNRGSRGRNVSDLSQEAVAHHPTCSTLAPHAPMSPLVPFLARTKRDEFTSSPQPPPDLLPSLCR